MKEPMNITTERVDDLPLLLAHMQRMGLAALLDQPFPTHGNWQGLSLGGVMVLRIIDKHTISTNAHEEGNTTYGCYE